MDGRTGRFDRLPAPVPLTAVVCTGVDELPSGGPEGDGDGA